MFRRGQGQARPKPSTVISRRKWCSGQWPTVPTPRDNIRPRLQQIDLKSREARTHVPPAPRAGLEAGGQRAHPGPGPRAAPPPTSRCLGSLCLLPVAIPAPLTSVSPSGTRFPWTGRGRPATRLRSKRGAGPARRRGRSAHPPPCRPRPVRAVPSVSFPPISRLMASGKLGYGHCCSGHYPLPRAECYKGR